MDLIYLAHNRLEFTKASLSVLIENTNWEEVERLLIYDDNSVDGTREYLQSVKYPKNPSFRFSKFGSPVAAMNDYLCDDNASHLFAKIDSDTMVPKGWLDDCMRVLHLNPGLHLLGIEAFRPVVTGRIPSRSFDDAEFIGGIGLMRTSAFEKSLPRPNGRFGFTAWQQNNEAVRKGWLNPALPVFLLDWLPREPWRSLTQEYVQKGWNRDWATIFPQLCPYPEDRKDLWSWWCQ